MNLIFFKRLETDTQTLFAMLILEPSLTRETARGLGMFWISTKTGSLPTLLSSQTQEF